jgi:hypothetical protein
MSHSFEFTFNNLEKYYKIALDAGYKIITCEDYALNNKRECPTIVNRVDVDLSVKKTERLIDLFNKLGIKASFFIRLHANEYNPFSFENYRILKRIVNEGHEIGYHSEIIDQSVIWDEDPGECLIKDIKILETMFNTTIKGVASHGGLTGLNNLDFWNNHKPNDYELLYEAYDDKYLKLFKNSFYISDSEWTQWKCYDKGVLISGDNRSFGEHVLQSDHKLIYLLIHPDTYFDRHIYE